MLDESKINRLFLNYNIFNELKSVHGVRTGVIIFGLVRFLSKKVTRPKTVQTGLAWFFRFCSVFFRFSSVFFGLGSVWFFRVQAYKTETKPNQSIFSKF
jgi:hypothetical protein